MITGTSVIELKRWIFDKVSREAKTHNTFIDVEYVNGYYADVEKDTVKAIGDITRETEKAYCIKFSSGAIDGSYAGWNSWIPKSQVISISERGKDL